MRRNFASAAALLALTALSPVFADSDAVKDIPRPAFKVSFNFLTAHFGTSSTNDTTLRIANRYHRCIPRAIHL
jgi:N-acetylglutamate synthase/N-acetylornithine aminotransferase